MSFREPPVGSVFRQRMDANRLRHQEQGMHDHIMETPMKHWPESLCEQATDAVSKYGVCGDVLSEVVARWIRPLDEESTDE